MSKILVTVIGALSIALAVASGFTTTRETASRAAAVGIDAMTGYSHARVLEPGSRGSVVEI